MVLWIKCEVTDRALGMFRMRWVECSQGREQTGGPGLRALMTAFFRVLAILARLYLGDALFAANSLPCVCV